MPQTLDLGDHRLEYEWQGAAPPGSPALVFLHEGLGSLSAWRDFPARLASAAGCRALVYSRRGYGGSDPAPLPRPVRFMHKEALAVLPRVLDRLGVEDPILVGHSDGASIALIHAAEAAAKGRPVRGLLLEAPHVFVEPVCLEAIEGAVEAYRAGELKRSLSRHHVRDVDSTFRGWTDVWLDPEFRSFNLESLLPQIEAPVLALQGEEDPYGTLRQVESVAARCCGLVKLVVLSRCGHSPHRDRPDRTLEAMADFLRREVLPPRTG